jgi:hypothetical protein
LAELPSEKEKTEIHSKDFIEIGRYSNPAKVPFINSIFEARQVDFHFLENRKVIDGLLIGGGEARLFVAENDRFGAEEILKNLSFDDRQWPFK